MSSYLFFILFLIVMCVMVYPSTLLLTATFIGLLTYIKFQKNNPEKYNSSIIILNVFSILGLIYSKFFQPEELIWICMSLLLLPTFIWSIIKIIKLALNKNNNLISSSLIKSFSMGASIILFAFWVITSPISTTRMTYEFNKNSISETAANIFKLYDEGQIPINNSTDYSNVPDRDLYNNKQVKSVDSEYKHLENIQKEIASIGFNNSHLIDKDIIFLSTSGNILSEDGLLITRNDVDLDEFYKDFSYKGGASYSKISDNVYKVSYIG